jgi:hypothetical protein
VARNDFACHRDVDFLGALLHPEERFLEVLLGGVDHALDFRQQPRLRDAHDADHQQFRPKAMRQFQRVGERALGGAGFVISHEDSLDHVRSLHADSCFAASGVASGCDLGSK